MENFRTDLKHSLRMFWQSRGFTAAAVAALALGIGANTAVFSVVNTVLLKPEPFPDPGRIILFQNTSPQGAGIGASPAKFAHWRAQTSVVQDVSAVRTGVVNLTGGQFPEQVRSADVSLDYFKLFGVSTVLGRTFTPEEDKPNGPKVSVLSYRFWNRRFGGDPNIVGKTISLSNVPHVIVGVLAPGFDFREFGPAPDVFAPFQLDPATTDQGHYFTAAGRLKPGVTLEQAKARLQVSAQEYRQRFPAAMPKGAGFSVESFREAVVSNVRPILLVLAVAVAFVLLIACANVANLLLARAVGRRREIAIRAAIGAGRGRIIRQLLTESILLSLGGAAVGTLLGLAGIRWLLSVNTANLPRVGADGSLVAPDWRVLLFTVLVALITGVLFGLIPALQASRPDLAVTLKESSGRGGTSFRHNKARTVLVVTEVALAVVLLVGAALLIRSSVALTAVDPGFNAEHVLTMRMSLTDPRFEKSSGIEQLVQQGTRGLVGIPGVVSASATCCVPLQGGYGLPFIIVGRPLDGPSHGGGSWSTVSPGYFEVFRIPVVRGRSFTVEDTGGAEAVAIINQTMAKRFWPKGDPLNERIWIGKGVMKEFAAETPRRIVGIVGDVHLGGLDQDPGPSMYVPSAQVPDAANALNVKLTPMAWVVRTQGEPGRLSAAIQNELRRASGLPVSDVQTMEEIVNKSTSRQRFNMLLMTVFGSSALVLAAIGIYGLMAYSVQQRTQEIGIRMALGAETSDVQRMVVLQGMRLTLAGVILGVGVSLAVVKVIASFLYSVQPRDPMVFTAVPFVLALVGLVAIWIPALRATRIDPLEALRYE